MQAASARERSDPILIGPALAPHLRGSAVLKMLHEEEGVNHLGSGQVPFGSWPPPDAGQMNRPMGFMTKVTRGQGGRPVEWPPRHELSRSQENLDQVSRGRLPPAGSNRRQTPPPPVPPRPANYPQAKMDQVQVQQQQQHQQMVMQQQHQQQRQQVSSSMQMKTHEEAPNLTTTYPSGFKLKDQAPYQIGPAKVVTSQPAFKITQPIRRRGDDKWPPRGANEPTQEEVREFIKPKKSSRNYEEFFAQNALPHNYAGYRPPPGTQHHGLDEMNESGVSEM